MITIERLNEFEKTGDPKRGLSIGKYSNALEIENMFVSYSEIEDLPGKDFIEKLENAGYERFFNSYLSLIASIIDPHTGEKQVFLTSEELLDYIRRKGISVIKYRGKYFDAFEKINEFHKSSGDIRKGLNIGAESILKEMGYEIFREWLSNADLKKEDLLEAAIQCFDTVSGYRGYSGGEDLKKEKYIFDGLTIREFEDSHRFSSISQLVNSRYSELINDMFSYAYWPSYIKEAMGISDDGLSDDDIQEVERDIEDSYGETNFLQNLLKYFINKWEIKL